MYFINSFKKERQKCSKLIYSFIYLFDLFICHDLYLICLFYFQWKGILEIYLFISTLFIFNLCIFILKGKAKVCRKLLYSLIYLFSHCLYLICVFYLFIYLKRKGIRNVFIYTLFIFNLWIILFIYFHVYFNLFILCIYFYTLNFRTKSKVLSLKLIYLIHARPSH